MHISLTEAKAQLTDLVRRAEAGDEIILTRHGQPAARLIPIQPRPGPEDRLQIIKEIQNTVAPIIAARKKTLPSAARSQDFLYGDDGLPK